MTIFRRRSKNYTNEPPVLEASPSPSAYFLGDFDKKNVEVSSECRDSNEDDSSSTSSNCSNSTGGLDDSEASLIQAFSDFSVELDKKDDNVLVKMDVPANVPVEDLNVQVDDGILRVSGDVSSKTSDTPTAEQYFQLDEQSLDVDQVTANLSDGVLTITAPKKDQEDMTLLESLPILSQKPHKVDKSSFRVIVDVPGVHLEDMHVSYANGKLRIAANRHFGRVRSFKRTIMVDTQRFDADLLKVFVYRGRLTVLVPPKEESVSRTIDIQTRKMAAGPGLKTLKEDEEL